MIIKRPHTALNKINEDKVLDSYAESKDFEIPSYKLQPLIDIIEKWRKKGATIDVEVLEKYYNKSEAQSYYRVRVSGGYKLNDWELAASIDHNLIDGEYQNIVRALPDFIGKIPDEYKTVAP